ncbi:MAG: ASCH domain-containing protein [Kofleriaceae bacterium]
MLALILERAHAFVDPVPDLAPAGDRPLVAVHAALPTITLPAPAGSRACAGGRDFAFVVDRSAAPGASWRPIRECDDATWQLYVELMLGGYEPPTRAIDVWSFGDGPEMAAQLAHLVMCGAKRVTMGWNAAAARSGTPVAYVGGVSVVTDGFGYPRIVLRTIDVPVMPFDAVTAADAAGEGEGDLSYADWRESHERYFRAEAVRHDLVFDGTSELSVERFEVLHVVGVK